MMVAGTPGPTLKTGNVFAVEPMVNIGSPETVTLDDHWSVVTADGSLSAHFEHTIAVTPDAQYAACGRANQIFVYHVPTGQVVARLDHGQAAQGDDLERRHALFSVSSGAPKRRRRRGRTCSA